MKRIKSLLVCLLILCMGTVVFLNTVNANEVQLYGQRAEVSAPSNKHVVTDGSNYRIYFTVNGICEVIGSTHTLKDITTTWHKSGSPKKETSQTPITKAKIDSYTMQYRSISRYGPAGQELIAILNH